MEEPIVHIRGVVARDYERVELRPYMTTDWRILEPESLTIRADGKTIMVHYSLQTRQRGFYTEFRGTWPKAQEEGWVPAELGGNIHDYQEVLVQRTRLEQGTDVDVWGTWAKGELREGRGYRDAPAATSDMIEAHLIAVPPTSPKVFETTDLWMFVIISVTVSGVLFATHPFAGCAGVASSLVTLLFIEWIHRKTVEEIRWSRALQVAVCFGANPLAVGLFLALAVKGHMPWLAAIPALVGLAGVASLIADRRRFAVFERSPREVEEGAVWNQSLALLSPRGWFSAEMYGGTIPFGGRLLGVPFAKAEWFLSHGGRVGSSPEGERTLSGDLDAPLVLFLSPHDPKKAIRMRRRWRSTMLGLVPPLTIVMALTATAAAASSNLRAPWPEDGARQVP